MLKLLGVTTLIKALNGFAIANFNTRSIPMFAQLLEGQELVDYINTVQPFFKADKSAHSYEELLTRVMDKKYLDEPKVISMQKHGEENVIEVVPENFDARERWPECDSIKLIRDQANCASCWAVASASAMSDRVCIQSKGKIKTIISDADIIACCTYCGNGCHGGYAKMSWDYVVNSGSCSGGPYATKDACKPYPFHPCGQHEGQPYYGECRPKEKTPVCKFKCQKDYKIEYEDDKIMGKGAYFLPNNEKAIRREIMMNGPVQASFVIYADFLWYKSGIYTHTAGKELGGHAVKIIGWGTENNVPYWLISNSWNSDWGEEGLFRILRGSNECLIEESVVAGLMDV